MKSKANLKGHPIHPILIGFPIAFLSTTVLMDLIHFFVPEAQLDFVYYAHLAGIVSAIAAAIPGLVDFVYTVPPQSSARKRAAQHGLLNTGMLLLFLISFYCRTHDLDEWLLWLELPGLTLMLTAGWMGGTLVHRNLIGVDMRYANAGKWKEVYPAENNGLFNLAGINDLQTDQIILCHIAGKRIALAKTATDFVAFDDRCSHRGGSLAGGMMVCGTVQCPWHGSQFEVNTGEVKAGPAKEKINTYPLHIQNGRIYLNLKTS